MDEVRALRRMNRMAVIDYDVHDGSDRVHGLEGYSSAVLLLRYRGQPIGRSQLEVRDGRFTRADALASLDRNAPLLRQRLMVADLLGWQERPEPRSLPSATVAICTRNRPDDLRRCLGGVMSLLDDGQEGCWSSDNTPPDGKTREVVTEFPSVRYACQPRPGLNHAPELCAGKPVRGEVVAFIDDDATPTPNGSRRISRTSRTIVLAVTG